MRLRSIDVADFGRPGFWRVVLRVRIGILGLVVLAAAAAAWYLVIGTPFYGGFRWGLDTLLILLGVLAVAITVWIVAGRVRARRGPAEAVR